MWAPDQHGGQVGGVLDEADEPCAAMIAISHAAGRSRAAHRAGTRTRPPPPAPISRKTRSAWACEIVCGSRPLRLASASRRAGRCRSPSGRRPGPRRRRRQHGAEVAQGRGARSARRGSSLSPVARQNAYAAAITAIEARKWQPTTQGLRSVSTVIPPTTAWAGMPSPASRPTAVPAGAGAGCCRGRQHEAGHGDQREDEGQHPVAELDHPVDPHFGGGHVDSAVQRGQVEQPRPEPVRRTAPPVITMPTLAIEARATGRSAAPRLTRRHGTAGVRFQSAAERPPFPRCVERLLRPRRAPGHVSNSVQAQRPRAER